MAEVDALIEEKARRAVRALGRSGRVRAAYLFGSQVQTTADRDSDIDVAVFIDGAETWDFWRLARECEAARRHAGIDVELHVFPASSYDRPPRASFAQYILQHGLPLEFNAADERNA
jgi:predicted nucleotidyltransferase